MSRWSGPVSFLAHLALVAAFVFLWQRTPPPAAAAVLEVAMVMPEPPPPPLPVVMPEPPPPPPEPPPSQKVEMPEPAPVELPPEQLIETVEPDPPVVLPRRKPPRPKPPEPVPQVVEPLPEPPPVPVVVAAPEPRPPAPSAPPSRPVGPPADYLARVFGELKRNHVYPPLAQRRGLQGTVYVRFTIGADGKVRHRRLERSSGSTVLDHAADSLLDRVRLPPPPEGSLTAGVMEIVAPIDFVLR